MMLLHISYMLMASPAYFKARFRKDNTEISKKDH